MVLFMIILLLTACSNDTGLNALPKVKSITIQEMISFTEGKENSVKQISNEEDIAKIVDAFSNAYQEPGIADMADPAYEVKIGKESYYLWFSEDGASASIMNRDDTHTVYSVSSSEEIYPIIHAE